MKKKKKEKTHPSQWRTQGPKCHKKCPGRGRRGSSQPIVTLTCITVGGSSVVQDLSSPHSDFSNVFPLFSPSICSTLIFVFSLFLFLFFWALVGSPCGPPKFNFQSFIFHFFSYSICFWILFIYVSFFQFLLTFLGCHLGSKPFPLEQMIPPQCGLIRWRTAPAGARGNGEEWRRGRMAGSHVARYRPEHDVKLLQGPAFVMIISTVADTFTPVCVGQDTGEAHGGERTWPPPTRTSFSPRTQRISSITDAFRPVCAGQDRARPRANTVEKYVLLSVLLLLPSSSSS